MKDWKPPKFEGVEEISRQMQERVTPSKKSGVSPLNFKINLVPSKVFLTELAPACITLEKSTVPISLVFSIAYFIL